MSDPENNTAQPAPIKPAKKKTFWDGFWKFLSMGGFMLILIGGIIIAVVLSSVFQCK